MQGAAGRLVRSWRVSPHSNEEDRINQNERNGRGLSVNVEKYQSRIVGGFKHARGMQQDLCLHSFYSPGFKAARRLSAFIKPPEGWKTVSLTLKNK